MASDAQRIRDAAARYGRSLDAVAARYTNPLTGKRLTGEALILKTIKGESGGRREAVSSAGARGWAQFMPGTRAAVIRKYGVDPWRSPEEAVHALTLHMRGKLGNATGLEGYNPGSSSYPSYILGQRVGSTRGAGGRSSGGRGRGGGTTTVTTTTTSGASGSSGTGASTSSPFSPGPLSARLASVALEQPAGISTAGPALPSGLRPRYYVDVPSSGPPIPPPDPSLPDVTGQAVSFGRPQPIASGGPGAPSSSPRAASGSAPTGRGRSSSGTARGRSSIIGPNPGRIQPQVRHFMDAISGVLGGETVVGKDGTGHSKYTTTGNVSEHFTGAASDIPARGAKLMQLGRAALIAAGMNPKKARNAPGDLYNICRNGKRYQIIFGINDPARGGNHTDHLHVGVTSRRC